MLKHGVTQAQNVPLSQFRRQSYRAARASLILACCTGEKMGQSIVLRHWVWEDGTHGGPDAPVMAVTQQDVDEAQEQVQQQVSCSVRALSCA